MSFTAGERDKWEARLLSDGYDQGAIRACIDQVGNRELGNPLGYLRSMLKDYNNDKTGPSTKGLATSPYDPAWYKRERILGSLVMRPDDCSKCGWVHHPDQACAELCWCGQIHPLPNEHKR